MICGLRLRRQAVFVACLFAALFAAGIALATVGKFSRVTSSATFSTTTTAAATSSGASSAAALSGATASETILTAVLTINFIESGLGNVGENDVVTATAKTFTTYFCVNGGSNRPKAANKITIQGPDASGEGTFPVDHNGRISTYTSTSEPLTVNATPAVADPPFACPNGQTEYVFMTFTNITLHDDTTGGSGLAPDATTNPVALG